MSSVPKGRKIPWNDALEDYFKEINWMVYDDALLSYPYWKIHSNVHTDASDKQLGYVISQE